MQNLGLEPSSFTYDGLVRAVIWGRDIGDTMEVVRSPFSVLTNESLQLAYGILLLWSIDFVCLYY